MFKRKGYHISNYRFSIVGIIILMSAIGAVLIQRLQDSDERQFEKQIVGILAGLVIMAVISLIDYHFICKMYIPLYLLNILLMLICKYVTYDRFPLIYGWKHYDAQRWIKIGGGGQPGAGFEFMPSEITKIVLIIVMAKLFCILEKKLNTVGGLLIIFAVVGIPIFFVFDQPDLSTSIVLVSTFAVMLFVAGLSYKIVVPTILVGVPAFLGLFWYVQQDYQRLLHPWQQDRILSILHPEQYPDLMYQQNNAAAAIESGGMFGKLILGDGSARLTNYVPVVESDFIFTAVAEELGFLGCLLVILLFLVFTILSFRIAMQARDRLGSLIAIGIAVLIMVQALVNIGVVTSLLPNTGIPLPFMSSGLSSLMTNMMTIGILLNIGLQTKESAEDHSLQFDFTI